MGFGAGQDLDALSFKDSSGLFQLRLGGDLPRRVVEDRAVGKLRVVGIFGVGRVEDEAVVVGSPLEVRFAPRPSLVFMKTQDFPIKAAG